MRPNILYIHSHDTGRYVQPYGHAVPTPHIQRLAEEGVLFRQAFCMAPTCSPSRTCLLTGQSAHNNGMFGLAHRGFSLANPSQHLASFLRRQGYMTALAGVQHESRDAQTLGYDHILPMESTLAEVVAPAAVNFLQQAPRQPFFLSVGFCETHRRFPEPGPEDDARYLLPPRPLPDTAETRADMAAFHASARRLDAGIGRVLTALADTGLAENTLVICTTDHGLAFPEMKCTLSDHGIGVMLLMRGPGGFSGGHVCDALVSQIDIYPTICDLLGLDRPEWLQGGSMLPLLAGADAIHDEVFAEVTYHAAYEPQRAVRTRRWKYIRRFDAPTTTVLPNCDDSLSKTHWMAHGWRERAVPDEQLYDLVFDPSESCNRAGDPAMAEALQEMRDRLARWMQATDDPLLRGAIPAPAGAAVNAAQDSSPSDTPVIVA